MYDGGNGQHGDEASRVVVEQGTGEPHASAHGQEEPRKLKKVRPNLQSKPNNRRATLVEQSKPKKKKKG